MVNQSKQFNSLAISNPDELIFGKAAHPLNCGRNLKIGGGLVYPEINFTLPAMEITEQSWMGVKNQYQQMIEEIIRRAVKLNVPGLVVEFEQLPPMTDNPQWGAEITKLLADNLEKLYNDSGIANALRVTIVDLRDGDRPPILRHGKNWEKMKESFIFSAQAGADILSIESVGGKEVHDQALMYGDLTGVVFSLGLLAHRDMSWLWQEITKIAKKYNVIPGGDTACGFSNTAMQLAGKGMLPSLLAALDRAASVPRSLAAYEQGAIGPSKDCAYEGPMIKAITGYPISMEGKSSCCAHFSHLGNIAAAAADLWSNESVQSVRLLSGSAPEAFMELLVYDCRLFNAATQKNDALKLRNWLVDSDAGLNVEAFILKPESVFEISESIVGKSGGLEKTVATVKSAFKIIKHAVENNQVRLAENEFAWLDRAESELSNLPKTNNEALEYLKENYGQFFNPKAYGLK